jgi:hypothetical protein
MFDPLRDPELDIALRDGLRSVPVPVAGPDFDSRVLSDLENPLPWWRALRSTLKPAFGGAAFSLITTLIVVNWALRAPERAIPGHSSGITTVAIEQALDSPNLTASSLTRLRSVRAAITEPAAIPQSSIQNPKSQIHNPQSPRPGQSRAPASRTISLV